MPSGWNKWVQYNIIITYYYVIIMKYFHYPYVAKSSEDDYNQLGRLFRRTRQKWSILRIYIN